MEASTTESSGECSVKPVHPKPSDGHSSQKDQKYDLAEAIRVEALCGAAFAIIITLLVLKLMTSNLRARNGAHVFSIYAILDSRTNVRRSALWH
jgi:hypothetical protein